MKKFFNGLLTIGGVLLGILLLVGLLAGMTALQTTGNNFKEQAYAEGQVDAINDNISFVTLAKESTTDTEKACKLAYAQGLEDAFNDDIRVRAVNDSTYVWTKSPWGNKSKIPTDTILIKKNRR